MTTHVVGKVTRRWLSGALGSAGLLATLRPSGSATGLAQEIASAGQTGMWTVDSLWKARSDMVTAVAGTEVLFAGGWLADGTASDTVDIYDGVTGAWFAAGLSRARTGMAAVTVGTRALFAAGRADDEPSASDVDIYDSVTGVWTADDLPQVREASIAMALGNTAVFVGPTAHTPNVYSPMAADSYDCDTGTWSSTSLEPAPRAAAVALAGGHLVLAGGDLGCGKPCVGRASAAVHVYAGATKRWTAAALSLARWGIGVAVIGPRALFGGGTHEIGNGLSSRASNAVDIYDATTGRWTTAALSQARSDPAAVTVGMRALFAGGWQDSSAASNAVDIYDATTGRWTTAALSSARGAIRAVTVGTRVLFAGGWTGSRFLPGAPADVVDIYDAATGVWSTGRLSRVARELDVVVSGTQVLFYDRAGGPDGRATEVIDIYDAATQRWSAIRLSLARAGLAVAAAGKRVIFAGGLLEGQPSDRVDIYDPSSPSTTGGA